MKVDLSDEFATFGTDEMVCPYCGHINGDSWEYHEDDGDADCGECSKRFDYSRHVSITYNTKKVKP